MCECYSTVRKVVSTNCRFASMGAAAVSTATTSAVTCDEVTSAGTINLGITLTWSVTGDPVMVNASGHEKVWSGGVLRDLDEDIAKRDARSGVVRYYNCSVTVAGFADGTTPEAKAAALGHTYSGAVSSSNSKLVLRTDQPVFNKKSG